MPTAYHWSPVYGWVANGGPLVPAVPGTTVSHYPAGYFPPTVYSPGHLPSPWPRYPWKPPPVARGQGWYWDAASNTWVDPTPWAHYEFPYPAAFPGQQGPPVLPYGQKCPQGFVWYVGPNGQGYCVPVPGRP